MPSSLLTSECVLIKTLNLFNGYSQHYHYLLHHHLQNYHHQHLDLQKALSINQRVNISESGATDFSVIKIERFFPVVSTIPAMQGSYKVYGMHFLREVLDLDLTIVLVYPCMFNSFLSSYSPFELGSSVQSPLLMNMHITYVYCG